MLIPVNTGDPLVSVFLNSTGVDRHSVKPKKMANVP